MMVEVKKPILKKLVLPGFNRATNTLDGIPVVDAKKPVKLSITPKDVSGSRSKAPDRCAAAVACIRQLKAIEARVHLGRTYLRYNGKWIRYITPIKLQKEIISFDRGGTFEPGDYRLLAPQPTQRMGKSSPARTGKEKKKPQKNGGYVYTANVRDQVVHHN